MANEDAQCRQSWNMRHPCTASKAVKSIPFLCIQALCFWPFPHKKCWLIIIPSNGFPRCRSKSSVDFFVWFYTKFPPPQLEWHVSLGGIARGMGAWGLRRLLGCCIAGAGGCSQAQGELEKINTVECSGQGSGCFCELGRKSSLLPSARGSFAVGWGVPCFPLSALTVRTVLIPGCHCLLVLLPCSQRHTSQLLLKPVTLIPDLVIIPP